jgi:excisionase family DNA binding protein
MAVMIKEDVYLTTADALAYLRTAPRTLYRFLATGKIPAVRIGRQWRFRKADLDRWVESRSRHVLPEQKSPPLEDAERRARRVLVVDDQASVRELLERIFALAEYHVETVPDGQTALARLRAASFDLVVTDLQMPGMGGLELTREAKRLWPAIKVVIITGNPSQASAIDAVNIGVDGYLTKQSRVSVAAVWQRICRCAAALLAILALAGPAHAQANLTWDVNGAAPGTGGTGAWDTTSPFWFNGAAFLPWNNLASDNAIFGGTVGTVTLGTPINVHNLTFSVGGYTVQGSTLTLGGAAPTITTTGVATISSTIAGRSARAP